MATRLAVLAADRVVLPAASYFETEICRRIINELRPIFDSGVLFISAAEHNIRSFLEKQRGLYFGDAQGQERYRIGNEDDLPPYLRHERSATAGIITEWMSVGKKGSVRGLLAGGDVPEDVEERWMKVPDLVVGRPFLARTVGSWVLPSPTLIQLDAMQAVINEGYFQSFIEPLQAGLVTELVFLNQTHNIVSHGKNLPYTPIREMARLRNLLPFIDRCNAAELLALRDDERWIQVMLDVSNVESGDSMRFYKDPRSSTSSIGVTRESEVTMPRDVHVFTWLHLSDLHLGHGDATHVWDQRLVLEELVKDLRIWHDRPSVDGILVTGDVAFSGDERPAPDGAPAREYEDAAAFLVRVGKVTGVAADRIYVVPGNHDVQRPVDRTRNVARLLARLRDGSEKLDEAMAHAADRDLLAQRQAKYLAFAARFAPGCLRPAEPGALFWHDRISGHGRAVRLIGLNTALLAADDQDRGHLYLGTTQIGQALTQPPPEPDEVLIVLGHHPLRGGWLKDEQEGDRWLQGHAHVHLSGHVHEADSESARHGGGGSFVRVSAGAVHGEASEVKGHGYNVAAIVLCADGRLVLRVWTRRWTDKHKRFIADTENSDEGCRYAEHPLRG